MHIPAVEVVPIYFTVAVLTLYSTNAAIVHMKVVSIPSSSSMDIAIAIAPTCVCACVKNERTWQRSAHAAAVLLP